MENMKTLMSSEFMAWGTPQEFFNKLNDEFNFTLDPCANSDNAKCKKYFTEEIDGLSQNWDDDIVFCNPPYGRAIKDWVKKASESKGLVVMLIPARTDTLYWHNYIFGKAEIRFIKGRLKFEGLQKGSGSAPFPSAVIIFGGDKLSIETINAIDAAKKRVSKGNFISEEEALKRLD